MPITRPTTLEEAQGIVVESIINNTDKVTKVNEASVLSAVSYGVANLFQRAQKDNTVLESALFPDSAYGTLLDAVASSRGISARFEATGSSGYLRLVGDEGTAYIQGVQTFTGRNGITFELEGDVTIGSIGYTYAKVRSIGTGSATNVAPNTITVVSPVPSGHKYVTNEYQMLGGRNNENDVDFRNRVKESLNLFARSTLSAIEQAFKLVNPNILRVYNSGSFRGRTYLSILTQNGANLSNTELGDLLSGAGDIFNITELRPNGNNTFGIVLKNVVWKPIDVSFRVVLENSADPVAVRQNIQINFAKLYDYRYWEYGRVVERNKLISVVTNTKGVKTLFDNYFYPNTDLPVRNEIPRFRGFIMLNTDGSVIETFSDSLNPVYYPSEADFSFQKTVLSQL